MNFNDYHLKENPFRIGPPLNSSEIVWAGFENLKNQIEARIKIGIKTTPSKIILNWGRYGSGKTHAANYFTKTSRISEICGALDAKPVKAIKLNLPRTSKDPVQAFLRSFLGQISLQKIWEDFKSLKELIGIEVLSSNISALSSDGVITEIFLKIATTEDVADLTALEYYLFGDNTKGTLHSLGLPAGLKDDEQVVNLLSTYINVVTQDSNLYSLFLLWIDEFEDIDTLNKVSQDRITTFLRQLFDKSPNKLNIFLNFTPKTFFNIEDLSVVLGEALSTRARLRINFEEPTVNDARIYILELMNDNYYRLNPTGNNCEPFSDEQTIIYVLEHIGRLSVRKINEVFSLLLELGLLSESNVIDRTFIDANVGEIVAWEN